MAPDPDAQAGVKASRPGPLRADAAATVVAPPRPISRAGRHAHRSLRLPDPREPRLPRPGSRRAGEPRRRDDRARACTEWSACGRAALALRQPLLQRGHLRLERRDPCREVARPVRRANQRRLFRDRGGLRLSPQLTSRSSAQCWLGKCHWPGYPFHQYPHSRPARVVRNDTIRFSPASVTYTVRRSGPPKVRFVGLEPSTSISSMTAPSGDSTTTVPLPCRVQ